MKKTRTFIACGFSLTAALVLAQSKPPPATKEEQEKTRLEQDVKRDTDAGRKYAEEVEKTLKLSKDEKAIERVQRIGAEIAKLANENGWVVTWGDKRPADFAYTFKVIEGEDVNAFSLPGGFIYIYEGLLKFSESDDEVAGVIGHEIAHAAFRHVATLQREQSKLQLVQIPLILATILTGGRTGDLLQLGSLVGTALTNGWSVNAEKAADYGGFQMLRKSAYNPVGMLTFMERLAKRERVAEGAIDWGIYRTHPPSHQRAESLEANLRTANIPIKRSQVTTSFRVVLKEATEGSYEAYLGSAKLVKFGGDEAEVRGKAAVTRLNEFFDGTPALFELRVVGDRLIGSHEVLFELTSADADVESITPTLLRERVSASLKKAIYNINYRVWGER